MMAQPIFDTLGFVKRLSAAGMEPAQAEALAEALTNHAFEQLATKADLRELELRLRSEIKDLELRLTNTLTNRMGVMTAASTGLTVAILGALITLS
jgi:hypothetical protein